MFDLNLYKCYIFTLVLFNLMLNCLFAQESLLNPIIPRYDRITIPDMGFVWVDNDFAVDSCLAPADSGWRHQSGEDFDLWVAIEGPHGSGRYWKITISVNPSDQSIPKAGSCLETSTLGWRTLQNFNKLPLQWIGDENANQRPEFILWDSFPLHDDASMAEFGLIGWVYEIDSAGILEFNSELTHVLASEIASAYRIRIEGQNARLQKLRDQIAVKLEEFARD